MNGKKTVVRNVKLGLCAIAGLLAVMGLCFTWKCPLDCVYGIDSGVFLFKKQLLWNGIGAAACIAAALVPWRRWLKLAPWGMVVWFVLSLVAAYSLPRHGTHRWADFDFVCVNVNLVLVLSWALFSAWLCSRKSVRPWMIFVFVGILLVFAGFFLLGNANRLARIGVFFGAEDANSRMTYMQMQMKAAYTTAGWFGDADRSLRLLPVSYADAMPSAAALIFGKWFTLTTAALFALFGGLLAWVWSAFRNSPKRMFVVFWGVPMVFSAFYSFYQSVGLCPVAGFSPALAGYGGAMAVIFWAGLGILLSMISDENGAVCVPTRRTLCFSGVWVAIFALFALRVMVVSASGHRFYTVLPKPDVFGEFGVSAKRGEIFAADGSSLATSVKSWCLRIDPVTARKYGVAFNPQSVTNICARLGLTPGELLNLCNLDKSRYILVRPEIDESVARWFLSDKGRRLSKGFIVETVQKRVYPLGSNAVHVTGCIHSWRTKATKGAAGLEYTCDAVLAGKDGVLVRDVPRTEQKALATPVHGGSVTTTVVPSIQNALADALVHAMASNRAETAWGIVMNAKTGAIAAMASLPAYDPAGRREIKDGPDYFVNNAAMAGFEPGTILKPVLDVVSGENMSVTGCLSRLGFGRKVGGGTVYGEATGVVRSGDGDVPDKFVCSVTGLQIANAYAAIANSGKTVAPHLVSKTVSTNGTETVHSFCKMSEQAVPDSVAEKVVSAMTSAMASAAKEFSVDFGGVTVAGALSAVPLPVRAEGVHTACNAFVAGFFPVSGPEWVVVTGFGRPSSGDSVGKSALSAFSEIIRFMTTLKGR